jgi:hypothetical protein
MKILKSRFSYIATVKPSTASVKKKRSIRSCALWLIPLFLGVIIGGILGYFVPKALLKPTENITSTIEGPISSSTEKRYALILQKLNKYNAMGEVICVFNQKSDQKCGQNFLITFLKFVSHLLF